MKYKSMHDEKKAEKTPKMMKHEKGESKGMKKMEMKMKGKKSC
jgi:hypothetical protein